MPYFFTRHALALTATTLSLTALPALADTITGDLTVKSHLCVGSTCRDGGVESFGAEELKLRENNVRLLFEDSSLSPGFPTNDWMLVANGDTNANRNFFGIADVDGGTMPFAVDAGARENALRVAGDGKIGIGTALPAEDLHIRTSSTPIIRLEQDGSGSFGVQTWNVGGNSFGFFIEDVSNNAIGSNFNLPFRILPGGTSNNGLVIAGDGDIGMGTDEPQARLHVAGQSMLIQDAGRVNFTLSDTSNPGPDFRTQLSGGSARFSFVGSGVIEMKLSQGGDLEIAGNYLSSGTQLNVPDYVFADDYALRPLAEVQSFIDAHSHLPEVPSAAQIAADGLDMSEMQMTLLKKIEELTLYTLQQEATIAAQNAKLAKVAALEEALARMDAKLDAFRQD